MDLPEQVARYRNSRAGHLADLAKLDRQQWQRAGRHEAAGDMTVQLYEAHVASEDVDYLAQIARLLDPQAAPG